MEQALLNKLKDGTADDIDIEMIASRCKVAHIGLLDLIKEYVDKLEEYMGEREEELKIGKCTPVIGYTDQPVKLMGRDTAIRIVYEHGPFARDMLNKLQEDAAR